MSLFKHGKFTSHSGLELNDKIDCDALTQEDWDAVAHWFHARLPSFGRVIGIPNGGLGLAYAMRQFIVLSDTVLIVDDVLTTGKSMEEAKQAYPKYNAVGAVLFARTKEVPGWIIPRFMENV